MTYIVFNKKNGEILSLSNLEPEKDIYPDLDWGVLDEEIINVIDILAGRKQASSYVIMYNMNKDKWQLRERSEFDATALPIADLIYNIPKLTGPYTNDEIIEKFVNTYDITIVKDNAATCYKFLIGSYLERQLRKEDSASGGYVHFSVTGHNNPNILHRTINVELPQLVKNHYIVVPMIDIEEETNPLVPLSIFTNKRWDSYIFIEVT